MKHLKLFSTQPEYDSFKNSDEWILPNVSFLSTENVVKFTQAPIPYTMVDLGLPSGLKWANMNVGATSPEDYGLFFQWGDTVGYTAEQIDAGVKDFSDWSTYCDTDEIITTTEREWDEEGEKWLEYDVKTVTFKKYGTNKLTTLESSDDAASVHMGDGWRMPTRDEVLELIQNTTITYAITDSAEEFPAPSYRWLIEGDLKYLRFTGLNGNSIIIPAQKPGQYSDFIWTSTNGVEVNSDADSSKKAIGLYTAFDGMMCYVANRLAPLNVRGVCN